MRPLVKGNCPQDNNIDIVFAEYREARPHVINRIGDFCSYCENQITNPAIEHIIPKLMFPALLLEWSNFLLACLNCNSIKNQQQDNALEYYWADIHNTHLLFDFHPQGVVTINANLHPSVNIGTANNTFLLTGIGRYGTAASFTDRRWIKRSQTYGMAEDSLSYYISNGRPNDYILSITNNAIAIGFWSVWMKVFENEQPVKAALTQAFLGTFALCETTDVSRQ
jgi:hypothetical protein